MPSAAAARSATEREAPTERRLPGGRFAGFQPASDGIPAGARVTAAGSRPAQLRCALELDILRAVGGRSVFWRRLLESGRLRPQAAAHLARRQVQRSRTSQVDDKRAAVYTLTAVPMFPAVGEAPGRMRRRMRAKTPALLYAHPPGHASCRFTTVSVETQRRLEAGEPDQEGVAPDPPNPLP